MEAVCVIAAGVLTAGHRPSCETAAFAWWMACAIALIFIDVSVHRLPDRLTYPAAVGTASLLAVAAVVQHDGHAWLRAMIGGLGSAAAFALTTLLLGRRGGYGLGDAKLMLSTGMALGWLGWYAVAIGLLLAWTAQGLLAIAVLIAGRANRFTHLAFGPFLIGGAMTSIALVHF